MAVTCCECTQPTSLYVSVSQKLRVLVLLRCRYLNEHQVGKNTNTCRLTSAMSKDAYDSADEAVKAPIKFIHSTICPVKATYRLGDRRLTLQTPICDVLRTPVDVVKEKFKVAINNTIHRTLVPDSRPVVAATPASV